MSNLEILISCYPTITELNKYLEYIYTNNEEDEELKTMAIMIKHNLIKMVEILRETNHDKKERLRKNREG